MCKKCVSSLVPNNFQSCPACGAKNYDGTFCGEDCASGFIFDQLLVCVEYRQNKILKRLITMYKYKFLRELYLLLGQLMYRQLWGQVVNFRESEVPLVVVPVPLHKKKLKLRGFNQSLLLAEQMAREHPSALPLIDCLERKIYRSDQAKLNRAGRLSNLQGCIVVKRDCLNFLRGRRVVLVDDVSTTGSTLNECSRALKAADVKYVCGLVLARAR